MPNVTPVRCTKHIDSAGRPDGTLLLTYKTQVVLAYWSDLIPIDDHAGGG